MTTHHSRRVAAQASQLAFAVPQVVAHRVARMMTAGPNPSERDRREFTLMGAEKLAAFSESWIAMGAQMMKVQQSMALSMLKAWSNPWNFGAPALMPGPQELQRAALGVLGSGLAPVHRAAVANARRLGSPSLASLATAGLAAPGPKRRNAKTGGVKIGSTRRRSRA